MSYGGLAHRSSSQARQTSGTPHRILVVLCAYGVTGRTAQGWRVHRACRRPRVADRLQIAPFYDPQLLRILADG